MTVFWIVGSHQGGTGAAGRDEAVKFPYEGLLIPPRTPTIKTADLTSCPVCYLLLS
jgi:hypothetical protein